MLYLLSIFKNNDQYKYTLQCLKLCWTVSQHPVETWVVHRQSSVLLERLPCSRSTRNRIMHPILYLLNEFHIQYSNKICSVIYTVHQLFRITLFYSILSIQISVHLQHQMHTCMLPES
jgi:hypothetical protein